MVAAVGKGNGKPGRQHHIRAQEREENQGRGKWANVIQIRMTERELELK